jgi:hypothetical protein
MYSARASWEGDRATSTKGNEAATLHVPSPAHPPHHSQRGSLNSLGNVMCVVGFSFVLFCFVCLLLFWVCVCVSVCVCVCVRARTRARACSPTPLFVCLRACVCTSVRECVSRFLKRVAAGKGAHQEGWSRLFHTSPQRRRTGWCPADNSLPPLYSGHSGTLRPPGSRPALSHAQDINSLLALHGI